MGRFGMGESDPGGGPVDFDRAVEALVARLTPLMIHGMAGVSASAAPAGGGGG